MERDAHCREDIANLTTCSSEIAEFGALKGKVGLISDDLLFAMDEEEADNFLEGNW